MCKHCGHAIGHHWLTARKCTAQGCACPGYESSEGQGMSAVIVRLPERRERRLVSNPPATRGALAKAAFIVVSLALIVLSIIDGALYGFTARAYVVILAAGFVLAGSSFMPTGD